MSTTWWLPPPLRLTWYMAVSAPWSKCSASQFDRLAKAMPTLAESPTSAPTKGNGFPNSCGDPLSHDLDLMGLVEFFAQDDELVPGQPGQRVLGPQGRGDPFAHGDQQIVTRLVAMGIIDALEVVQVDEEHRDQLLRAPTAHDGMIDALDQEGAVREPGQGIMD